MTPCRVAHVGSTSVLTFVLTSVLFVLAAVSAIEEFSGAKNRRKPMKNSSSTGTFGESGVLSSVVEHILHTDGVAGSKPAARTSNKVEEKKHERYLLELMPPLKPANLMPADES